MAEVLEMQEKFALKKGARTRTRQLLRSKENIGV
jgi:hypothetical protein